MEDLLNQRSDDVIREKMSNEATPLLASPLEPHAFGLLEYLALCVSRGLVCPSFGRKLEIHMATINLRSHDPMVINTL